MKKNITIAIIVAIVIVIILFANIFFKSESPIKVPDLVNDEPKAVVCSQEAKICPDGSSVGRVGPNCEFSACPISTATTSPATTSSKGETFKGKITAYSTSCFADGICSVTVGGKVVITTIGFRAEKELGTLIGVESLGDFENKIGHDAEVYAEKTPEGDYTLYGNSKYYVKVLN